MYGLKQNKPVAAIRKSTWIMFLLVFALLSTTMQSTVRADGLPSTPDSGTNGSTNSPGTNNGPSDWPPAGAIPKGPFVANGFAGTWYAFVDNTAFTLVITQEEKVIKLAHTAIYDYGRRVDSSVGGVSMVGAVSGSLAYVEWKSGLSPENGRATLEYLPGRPVTLYWKIIDDPQRSADQGDAATPLEVSYFLPASAFLIKK